jgi:hypothetical protein
MAAQPAKASVTAGKHDGQKVAHRYFLPESGASRRAVAKLPLAHQICHLNVPPNSFIRKPRIPANTARLAAYQRRVDYAGGPKKAIATHARRASQVVLLDIETGKVAYDGVANAGASEPFPRGAGRDGPGAQRGRAPVANIARR